MRGGILVCVEDASHPVHREDRTGGLEGSWAWALWGRSDQQGGYYGVQWLLHLPAVWEILPRNALATGDPSFRGRRMERFWDHGVARPSLPKEVIQRIGLWRLGLGTRSCGYCFLLFLGFALLQWSSGRCLLRLLDRLITSVRPERRLEVADADGCPNLHHLRR